jgi:hypothetical protein
MLAVLPDKAVVIKLLAGAIKRLYKCDSVHAKTVAVFETFHGKTIWEGDVEVFTLVGHPKARRCFAWLNPRPGRLPQCVALLDIWPIISPGAAVKASIAMDIPLGPEGKHWVSPENE